MNDKNRLDMSNSSQIIIICEHGYHVTLKTILPKEITNCQFCTTDFRLGTETVPRLKPQRLLV